MKNLLVSLLVVVLLVTAAQATVFTSEYDGNALPTASTPAWTAHFNTGTSSVSGGVMTLDTTGSKDLLYRINGGVGSSWNPTGLGSTLEMRVKVTTSDSATSLAASFAIRTGVRKWYLGIALDHLLRVIDGPDPQIPMDFSDWTVLRMVIDEGDGGVTSWGAIDLYVNGTFAVTLPSEATSDNNLDFGDDLGGASGVTQWDYIKWTNEVAEVPEPATMALLSLGGIGMFFRRLKR